MHFTAAMPLLAMSTCTGERRKGPELHIYLCWEPHAILGPCHSSRATLQHTAWQRGTQNLLAARIQNDQMGGWVGGWSGGESNGWLEGCVDGWTGG